MRGAGGGDGGGSWSHTRIVLSAPYTAQKSLKLNREGAEGTQCPQESFIRI